MTERLSGLFRTIQGCSGKGHHAGVGCRVVVGGEHHLQLLLKETAQLRRQLFAVRWAMLLLLLDIFSAMAAHPQVQGVRVEIVLFAQVGLIEFAYIVIEQSDGNDQRYIVEAIGLNHLQRLLLFIS